MSVATGEPATENPPRPRLDIGAGALVGVIVEDLDGYDDEILGLDICGIYRPYDPRVGLRGSISYFKSSSQWFENSFTMFLIGPEFMVPSARLGFLIQGFVGTTRNSFSPVIFELDRKEWFFVWGVGLGLRGQFAGGPAPVSFEISGRVLEAGSIQVLRGPALSPTVSTVDVTAFSLTFGLMVGIPGT